MFVINHLYGYSAMEVQEAFTKIREQSKCYLQQPDLLANGLALVNTQNLDYFQPHHQAELFRLKGVFLQVRRRRQRLRGLEATSRVLLRNRFLQELSATSEANAAFSTSLTLCAQLPDGWLSWGAFCDAQYQATKDSGWLESAVTAYLQVSRGEQASPNGR